MFRRVDTDGTHLYYVQITNDNDDSFKLGLSLVLLAFCNFTTKENNLRKQKSRKTIEQEYNNIKIIV